MNPYKPGETIIYFPYRNNYKVVHKGTFYQNVPNRWHRGNFPDRAGIKYKQPVYGFKVGGYGYVWTEAVVKYSQIFKQPVQRII